VDGTVAFLDAEELLDLEEPAFVLDVELFCVFGFLRGEVGGTTFNTGLLALEEPTLGTER